MSPNLGSFWGPSGGPNGSNNHDNTHPPYNQADPANQIEQAFAPSNMGNISNRNRAFLERHGSGGNEAAPGPSYSWGGPVSSSTLNPASESWVPSAQQALTNALQSSQFTSPTRRDYTAPDPSFENNLGADPNVMGGQVDGATDINRPAEGAPGAVNQTPGSASTQPGTGPPNRSSGDARRAPGHIQLQRHNSISQGASGHAHRAVDSTQALANPSHGVASPHGAVNPFHRVANPLHGVVNPSQGVASPYSVANPAHQRVPTQQVTIPNRGPSSHAHPVTRYNIEVEQPARGATGNDHPGAGPLYETASPAHNRAFGHTQGVAAPAPGVDNPAHGIASFNSQETSQVPPAPRRFTYLADDLEGIPPPVDCPVPFSQPYVVRTGSYMMRPPSTTHNQRPTLPALAHNPGNEAATSRSGSYSQPNHVRTHSSAMQGATDHSGDSNKRPRYQANEGPRRQANEGPSRQANEGPRHQANEGTRHQVNEGPRRQANEGPREWYTPFSRRPEDSHLQRHVDVMGPSYVPIDDIVNRTGEAAIVRQDYYPYEARHSISNTGQIIGITRRTFPVTNEIVGEPPAAAYDPRSPKPDTPSPPEAADASQLFRDDPPSSTAPGDPSLFVGSVFIPQTNLEDVFTARPFPPAPPNSPCCKPAQISSYPSPPGQVYEKPTGDYDYMSYAQTQKQGGLPQSQSFQVMPSNKLLSPGPTPQHLNGVYGQGLLCPETSCRLTEPRNYAPRTSGQPVTNAPPPKFGLEFVHLSPRNNNSQDPFISSASTTALVTYQKPAGIPPSTSQGSLGRNTAQNYPDQNYPPVQNHPDQNYPPVQNYSDQNYPPVQNHPDYPAQNYPAQNYPAQNYPVQNYPYQNNQGQNIQDQNAQSHNYYDQNYEAHNYQIQSYQPQGPVQLQGSIQLMRLTNSLTTYPSIEMAMDPFYFPFVDGPRQAQPQNHGVVRLKNIPFATKRSEIIALLGRNCKILSDADEPVHIIMDRATSKTMDAYVEFHSLADAMRAAERHHNNALMGKHSRLGERPIEVELSSQGSLMKDLFPLARGVFWDGPNPKFQPFNQKEPWENFKGFISTEEMTMLVKHVEVPHRSPFSRECPQRPYECLISTLRKFPWYMTECITITQRQAIFNATCELLRLLARAIEKNDDILNLNTQLYKRVIASAMTCKGFTTRMKDDIAWIVDMAEATMIGFGQPRFASSWVHQYAIVPKPGIQLDVVEWFIDLIRQQTQREVLARPLTDRTGLEEKAEKTDMYWGYFWAEVNYVQGPQFDHMTLAQCAHKELSAVEKIVSRALARN
ncbi:hypothetical protein AK830_g10901 [Neonectria ditissima]|uniref:RRM domain-containing protein n=1 Tax=Neonectria ditissima TaxID=78410 RepID=A0A0P7B670_9HYPO|nr:hypothetical protein AK830_g10901 [Neonectria ditissima]